MPSQNAAIREIREWMLDARDEDSGRYFFPVHNLDRVQSGAKQYVIGRKGAGKTAIAEHIKALKGEGKTFVKSLSFKSFPFNELYKLKDFGYTNPSQYTTLWKYIILSATCSMMSENRRIDEMVASQLRKYFDIDIEQALARSIGKITDRQGGFTIMGSGANASMKSVVISNDTPWTQRVQGLEDIVSRYCDDSTYYIIFDELDEDYKDVLDIEKSSEYFDLMIGLFKAVHELKRLFRGKLKVFPVVFLRDDIYGLMRDNDKNKWGDSAINLSWDDGTLEQLVAFRISRAGHLDGPILSFRDAILAIFETETKRVKAVRSERRHVFRHIKSRTLMRPRDFISWIREGARAADNESAYKIRTDMFVDIDQAYSIRLREEFVDEMQAAMPEIDEIFDILSDMRKQVFTFKEFGDRYAEFRIQKGGDGMRFEHVCQLLFHFSAIGNLPSQRNNPIYKYVHTRARINFGEKAIIHPGLLKSLQIS